MAVDIPCTVGVDKRIGGFVGNYLLSTGENRSTKADFWPKCLMGHKRRRRPVAPVPALTTKFELRSDNCNLLQRCKPRRSNRADRVQAIQESSAILAGENCDFTHCLVIGC